ncbi:MAG: radical SAM family heme chaperone HemW [Planctomycetaceae bacterium]|nr:radical SAM family heme chaperone HemW [Planctomycetaceae bacterium]
MFAPARAAYIHVPFCLRRCGYCNFTVVAGRPELHQAYLQALEREFQTLPGPVPVDTLYVGGGTPTQLRARELSELCRLLRTAFIPQSGYEWTVEANPDGLDRVKLDILCEAGVNRISLGVQSLQPGKLQLLERAHRAPDVLRILPLLRARFRSVSLDLICAVPGESLAAWQADLLAAVALDPDHLSIYSLTFEKGSLFWGRLQRGQLQPVAEETERAMLEAAWDHLAATGWDHYEVSNFARPAHRSRHNEVYWRGESYWAFGPGATRYVDGWRETNHRSTTTYLRRVLSGQSPVAEREKLAPVDRAREMLVFRLRMLEGISRVEFRQRTGLELDDLVGVPLRKFVDLGLLQDQHGCIRLTRAGLLVSDAMWPEFL